jgi:hypothetical protein
MRGGAREEEEATRRPYHFAMMIGQPSKVIGHPRAAATHIYRGAPPGSANSVGDGDVMSGASFLASFMLLSCDISATHMGANSTSASWYQLS